MGGLEAEVEQLQEGSTDTNLAIDDVAMEIGRMQEQLGIEPGPAFEDAAAESFRCKGTYLGHEGPVWALAVYNDLLFSGSSDTTIKVWETSSAFSCRKTLQRHTGIVHCMLCFNHKLYSGSSDKTVIVWDIGTCEVVDTLVGHDNPVCTIAVENGMLFTGSLKSVRVWDVRCLHAFVCGYFEGGVLLARVKYVRSHVRSAWFATSGSALHHYPSTPHPYL
jgi:E3 ubiquitin-protein ligase TRAF7